MIATHKREGKCENAAEDVNSRDCSVKAPTHNWMAMRTYEYLTMRISGLLASLSDGIAF